MEKTTMKAYHNDHKVKEKYMARINSHIAADELIKGKYWERGKGCAVGCTIHSSDHGLYEIELGIPRVLARLEDGIFEQLPNELAKTWPKRFLESIKVGADLSNIWPQFAHWLMLNEKYGVIQFAKTEKQKESIQKVGDLYQAISKGLVVDIKDWRLARDAATSAAYGTATAAPAYAAAYAAAYGTAAAYAEATATAAAEATATSATTAADAVYSAAYAAAYAAAYGTATASAAAAAAYAAAEAYNRMEWRIAQSEKLLELLKASV